jgi:hypothetical protein
MRSQEARSAPPGTVHAHGIRRWWLNRSLRTKGLTVVAVPLIALMGLTSGKMKAVNVLSASTPVTWIQRSPRFSPTR